MGRTLDSSCGYLRSRLSAGGAVAAASVLAAGLVTAPPGTTPEAPIGVTRDVRAVQLATFVQPVVTPPSAAVFDVTPVGGTATGAPASVAAVIVDDPSELTTADVQAAAPDFAIARTVATWLLQPSIWFGRLLPLPLQPFYAVFIHIPLGVALLGIGSLIDSVINTVLGWIGIGTTVATAESVDANATSFATLTSDPLTGDPAPDILAATTESEPDADGETVQTPADASDQDADEVEATEFEANIEEAPAETLTEAEAHDVPEATNEDDAEHEEPTETTESELSDSEAANEPETAEAEVDDSVEPAANESDADDNSADDSPADEQP